MAVKVSFSDLTHTGQLVAANTFPLGISMVAAYAKLLIKDEIDLEIFKYPDDFSAYLETTTPQIACFSNFSWNIKLGQEYARRIKKVSPETITVFGGPNFPDEPTEQHKFLTEYSSVDCYIEYEGEESFVKLFEVLKTLDFDWEKFKQERPDVQNLRYLVDGELIANPVAPKVDLGVLPSPYEMGLMDKFFDETLIPMMQTTRGCPYTCTFCWEGGDYFRKTKRFTPERITQELNYIAQRALTSDLCIVDANFGMFKEDLDTTDEVLKVQAKHNGWPKTILTATAKNHKERTIEIVEKLGETLPPTAAVQSTNDEVLTLIRRKNVSQDALIALAKTVEKVGGQSEAELILCIEGDTKERHFKTVFDMLDADMTFIRMYQFMLIPGTQAARQSTRKAFEMVSRFRVLPRCFGTYSFRGETFPVAEIEEICIANKSMPHEDYQACRDLHLTVEIFNNDSIFADLIQFLRRHNLDRSEFIKRIHSRVLDDPKLNHLYERFREEEKKNLSVDKKKLETFAEDPNVIQKYIHGEYGTNELYKYRVLGIFDHIEMIHDIAYEVASDILEEMNVLSDDVKEYLKELQLFSLLRKKDPLNIDKSDIHEFHYDFVQLLNNHFLVDPFDAYVPDGIELEVYHSNKQIDLIRGYVKQYGTDIIGLSRIVLRANLNRLYRTVRRSGVDGGQEGDGDRDNRRTKLQLIA